MSLPTAELATTAVPALARRSRESLTSGLTGARFYVGLVVFALAAGAVSLLIPSTPSYDPWSWLIWGREIVHGSLQTTGGPSWKPLPMVFVTVFSPLGKAAPYLWLVVARAGAVMGAVMIFKLAATLTRLLVARVGPAADAGAVTLAGDAGAITPARGLANLAPGLLAGAMAATSLVLSGGFLSDSALGYSEGLMTALVLIAVERHFDGRPRQAFAVGFAAALDRPEIWLFWGPYGLWLFWRDPGARRLVLALFALIPVLWLAPEYWGSGHFFRGVDRAHQPRSDSSAFAHCPLCSELVDHAWPTVLLRLKVAAALGLIVAATLLWRLRAARGGWHLKGSREHALAGLLAAGALGVAWFVVIALMTQAGFSGNDRYLVLGAALIDIAGAAAFGWAALELAVRLSGVRTSRLARLRLSWPAAGVVAVALLAACYLAVPNWVGADLIDVPLTHQGIVYWARVRTDAAKAVRRLGGTGRVLACGTVMSENFQVPLVAWTLGVHILRVESSPAAGTPPPPAPNVIFQTRADLLPQLGTWPGTHYRLVARLPTIDVYASCVRGASL